MFSFHLFSFFPDESSFSLAPHPVPAPRSGSLSRKEDKKEASSSLDLSKEEKVVIETEFPLEKKEEEKPQLSILEQVKLNVR